MPVSASVAAAGVALVRAAAAMVLVPMVLAGCVVVVSQSPGEKLLNRLVRRAGDPGVKLDAGLCQRGFRTCADSAANQSVYPLRAQKRSQCAVPAA